MSVLGVEDGDGRQLQLSEGSGARADRAQGKVEPSKDGGDAGRHVAAGNAQGPMAYHLRPVGTRLFLLCVLVAAYAHNQCTRNSLVYAVNFACGRSTSDQHEYMNAALDMSASQYALLASYGFTLMYACVSLVAGRVADVANRPRTLAMAIMTWSMALALQASPVSSFQLVLACRMVQGVAIAFCAPQAVSLLTDTFSPKQLAAATSVYSAGLYIGTSLASLTMLLNARIGWRATFTALASFGAILSIVIAACVREPRAQSAAIKQQEECATDDSTLAQSRHDGSKDGDALMRSVVVGRDPVLAHVPDGLTRLWASMATLVAKVQEVCGCQGIAYVLAAAGVRFCAGYAIGVWAAPYFRARFPLQQARFAFVNAMAVGMGGCLSTLMGGALTSAISPRSALAPLLIPAAGFMLAVPLWVGALFCHEFHGAMACYVLTLLVSECWIGPVMFALSTGVPKEVCCLDVASRIHEHSHLHNTFSAFNILQA
jgi:MFS family permease